jgi:fatty acid synthase, animal type
MVVLVTGFSGRFPSSANISEFWKNLCDGVDLVTENSSRYPLGYSDLPGRQAQIPNIEKFDALFFGISSAQASCLDPQIRLLLESVYEAILDAGYTMEDLTKSNTGVYVGGCFSDMHKALLKDVRTITGYENTGCSHSMFANRVSFCFDFTGPSMTIDTACSSSLVALDVAARDIRSGKISRAIVAGVSIAIDPGMFSPPSHLLTLTLFPFTGVTKSFSSYGMLSPNGKCHSFDDQANGYVRADGIGAILLESESIARHGGIMKILGTGSNSDGSKVKGITYPDSNQQTALCRSVCAENAIDSNRVVYVEAHGTGTVAGDGQELRAISAAYAPLDSDRSIMIGSVKSNMGHAEGASGIMSLIKTLCILTDNVIPTNLHYSGTTIHEPILSGKLQVVNSTQPFAPLLTPRPSDDSEAETQHPPPCIAINNFGFGGTNAHLVCCSGNKELVVTTKKTRFVFGRTEEALYHYLNSNQLNEAAWQLLLRSSSVTNKFPWRGIVKEDDNSSEMQLVTQKISSDKPSIAFCYTGQGCQWNGMAQDLWRNETNSPLAHVFKSTILEACEDLDVNINELFSTGDCWMNKKWSGFGITLVQLGLTAMLKEAGISPDFIFGHSVGEVACGYADGCTSAKEAARIAFVRCQLSEKIAAHGLMLAVGLDYETATQVIQSFPETVIACHNSPDGVTLSGPENQIHDITTALKDKGIFAKIVPTDGIAYHSKFFQRNSDKITEVLNEVITDRPLIPRTSRWLSTSCPDCRSSSAHDCHIYPDSFYHTRNITGQVNFEPIVKSLPVGTIVIEIGPHNLLKSLIKRCREEGQEVTIYSTMQRSENSLKSMEKLIDQLWLDGTIFNFPVVTHMVPIKDRVNLCWDHDVDWKIPGFQDFERSKSHSSLIIEFDLAGSDSYLMDHIIDGRSILPATAHIYCAWQAYGTDDIHFVDIKILSAIILDGVSVTLQVVTDSSHWKIYHDEKLVSQGSIAAEYQIPSFETVPSPNATLPSSANECPKDWIASNDLYSRFSRFGYEYGEEFRAISCRSSDGLLVKLRPIQHWIVYLDNILQGFLHQPKGLFLPTSIGTISIRTKDVTQADTLLIGNPSLNSFGNKDVVLRGLKTTLARKIHKIPNMCGVEFIPYGEHIVKSQDEEFKKKVMDTLVYTASPSSFASPLVVDHRISTYLESVHNIVIPDTPYEGSVSDDESSVSERVSRSSFHFPIYEESLYEHDPILSCQWCSQELNVISQIIRDNLSSSYSLVHYPDTPSPAALASIGDAPETHKLDALYQQFHPLVECDILSYTMASTPPPSTPSSAPVDVILANNFFYRTQNILSTLENISTSLKPGGFLLLREYIGPLPTLLWGSKSSSADGEVQDKRQYGRWIDSNKWLDLIAESGLSSVMWCMDEMKTQMILLATKPPTTESDGPKVIYDREEIKSNLTAVLETNDYGYLGTIRSLRKEPGYDGITLRLDVTEYLKLALVSNTEISSTTSLPLSIYCNGILGGFHEIPLHKQPITNLSHGFYLKVTKPGDLQSLTWTENDNESDCEVRYCGVNFKDVMLSYGKLTTNDENGHVKLGLEFSGMSLEENKPVMGISIGCMATHIKTSPHLLWDIPSSLTLEQACTIPVVYSTVYYALVLKANIQSGQTVLIHSIAGGVGQAAYHVCKHRGVHVIATCSPEKKSWVHTHLGIPMEQILNSHTLQFRDEILCLTNGRGVDVVLNSLSGEKLHASLECVAQYGHFVEIGKFDIQQNTRIGMSLFEKNVSMHGFDLSDMFNKPTLWKPIRDLLSNGLQSGEVKPLCSTVFDHPEQALRYVGSGKHIGKVLVQINSSNIIHQQQQQSQPTSLATLDDVASSANSSSSILTLQSNFRTHGTHLVIGGLGGFGMELVLFLKSHGAEKIVISSRSQPKPSQLLTLGENVSFTHTNLKEYENANDLISSLGQKLIGIWHLGMVLNDCLYDNMTHDKWFETVSTKATICSNLDRASRLYSSHLQQFVMWSSVSALFGNAGQSNYAYGNSAMEGICYSRRSVGLPGLAIQWGFIGSVGILTKKGQTTNHSLGFLPQHIDSCLESLNQLLSSCSSSSSSGTTPAVATSYLRLNPISNLSSDDSNNSKAMSVALRVARVLGIDSTKISGNEMLSSLGMDSMQSVEISNILKSAGHAKSLEELRYVTWTEVSSLN